MLGVAPVWLPVAPQVTVVLLRLVLLPTRSNLPVVVVVAMCIRQWVALAVRAEAVEEQDVGEDLPGPATPRRPHPARATTAAPAQGPPMVQVVEVVVLVP